MSIETLRDRIDFLENEWAAEKAENAELKAFKDLATKYFDYVFLDDPSEDDFLQIGRLVLKIKEQRSTGEMR